jgi:scyllo-inositol 2-dehydrogenase (NADP+)
VQPISIGIIGFGRIGAEHSNWLSRTRSARAVAVADGTDARRKLAEENGLHAYTQIPDLLNDKSIEAVVVSTPTSMHFEHVQLALSAGKHVLVEKPMALDLDQSRRLADMAERAGKILSVFHNRRWDIDFLTVKKHLGAGVFGKIINIESRLGQWASCVGPAAREYRPGWRNEAAFGGGGLYDWGSHFVDQIWRLMWPAKPLRVFAQLRGNVWTKDCDDFARVLIDFDNSAVGMVEINTTTTRPLPRWHIDGTSGSADSPASQSFDTNEWAKLTFAPVDGAPQRRLDPANAGLSEIEIWDQFASAIRGQGEPAVSVKSVLGTMALLDAARKSSQRGISIDVSNVNWAI